MPNIVIVNASKVLTDADAAAVVPALQKYDNDLLCPAWGFDPCVYSFMTWDDWSASPERVDAAYWPLYLNRHSTDVGVGGFHDDESGRVYGRIFVGDALRYGISWTVDLSHEACFTGDTLIPLLNGTTVPIRDLVGQEHFWVYSITADGDIKPGRGHSAKLTRRAAEIVAVTLDDGAVVRCTRDHLFLMRDGTYKAAGELHAGDSLMPLYRDHARIDTKKKTSSRYEYERVYNPRADRWLWTHRVVAPICPSGSVRHHKDFDRFNNAPDNLEILGWEDHQRLHAQHIGQYSTKGKTLNVSEEHRRASAERGRARLLEYNRSDAQREALARYYARPGVKSERAARLEAYKNSPEGRERLAELSRQKLRLPAVREAGRDAIRRFWEENPEAAQARAEQARSAMLDLHRNGSAAKGRLLAQHNRWHVGRGIIKPECNLCIGLNHKVASVRAAGHEDVFDFTVDGLHNFALSAGVFVHNCEMRGDPTINRTVTLPDGRVALVELCDPVEDDSLAIDIDGVKLSDFVLPSYFGIGSTVGPYDHEAKLTGPCPTLTTGGYQSLYVDGGWTQVTALHLGGGMSRRSQRFHHTHRRPAPLSP